MRTYIVVEIASNDGEIRAAYGPYETEGQAVEACAEIENDNELLDARVLPLDGPYSEVLGEPKAVITFPEGTR